MATTTLTTLVRDMVPGDRLSTGETVKYKPYRGSRTLTKGCVSVHLLIGGVEVVREWRPGTAVSVTRSL